MSKILSKSLKRTSRRPKRETVLLFWWSFVQVGGRRTLCHNSETCFFSSVSASSQQSRGYGDWAYEWISAPASSREHCVGRILWCGWRYGEKWDEASLLCLLDPFCFYLVNGVGLAHLHSTSPPLLHRDLKVCCWDAFETGFEKENR